MWVKRRQDWAIPEREATPEAWFRMSRRSLIESAAAIGIGLAPALAARAAAEDAPTASLYPARHNDAYTLDRPVTPERLVTRYNNFYEFGSEKDIADQAQSLPLHPWQIKIDGLVEKERTLDIDDLLKQVSLEERLYRHRCVEAWSMAVPWTGFPLKSLVELAKPLASAKYLKMQTFGDVSLAPGLKQFWYPWPYTEGLTIEEATHDLAFLVTGAYGKPLPPQNGAPLRLATPWKYGFKSVKSIVRFNFTDTRPDTFWEHLQASEYGFWANVNPEVPHPRWSQATERVLGSFERRPTLLYNGYAEQVAPLYANLQHERLFV